MENDLNIIKLLKVSMKRDNTCELIDVYKIVAVIVIVVIYRQLRTDLIENHY